MGRGPSWAGAGGGVIALSSLSQGACVGRVSGLGPAQGETQPHKHAGHSTGAGGQAGEAGRRIALWESGQVGTPPPSHWSLGRRLSHSLPLWRGRGRGLVPGLGRDIEGRPGDGRGCCARVCPDPRPGRTLHPPTGSAADPPFARLGLGGHREALVTLAVRAAAADVRDLQLRVAVVLPAQRGLWTPGSRQCQARGCCQA